MKKLLTLTLMLIGLLAAFGCSTEETEETVVPPDQLKPPLGLVAFPGDRAVTLEFQSANTVDDDPEFWGFAAHMAPGEFAGGPGNYYEVADIAEFDAYGDGVVAAPDSDEPSGLQPVAYVEGGVDAVNSELGADLPGMVSWVITNGDAIPVLGEEGDGEAPADGEEPAADDDDDAEASLLFPAAATTGDDDDDTVAGDCTWGDSDSLCLINGQKYTVFVATRADEGGVASWSSNWTTFVPRPETATELTVTAGSGAVDGVDLDSFTTLAFTGDSNYTGTDADSETADLMVEALTGQYNISTKQLYWSACNSGLVQDLGFYSSWAEALYAPADDVSYITPGQSVMAEVGHVYAVKTGNGNYAKVWVTATDLTADTVTFLAAFQPAIGERNFK